jgi:hypothetical protein
MGLWRSAEFTSGDSVSPDGKGLEIPVGSAITYGFSMSEKLSASEPRRGRAASSVPLPSQSGARRRAPG